MKVKFVVLILVFLLALAMPVTAQENESSGEVVGSTWVSEQKIFRDRNPNNPLLVVPNQIGLGGTAEATVGMTWYGIPYNIVGTSISKIIGGSSTYNVCAQVNYVKRDGINKGGSSRNCGEIGVGGNKQADHRVWEDWHGSSWVTQSWHEFSRTGSYWAPLLSVSQNL